MHNNSRPTATVDTDDDRHRDLRAAVEIVGDRWVLLLIAALADGPCRFGDLAHDVRGVAPNVLSDRLRRAERAGLLLGTAYQHRPRRLVYELTEAGHEVAAILPALSAWSARRRGEGPPRHRACGTPLEVRWWCPECAVTAEAGHLDGAGGAGRVDPGDRLGHDGRSDRAGGAGDIRGAGHAGDVWV